MHGRGVPGWSRRGHCPQSEAPLHAIGAFGPHFLAQAKMARGTPLALCDATASAHAQLSANRRDAEISQSNCAPRRLSTIAEGNNENQEYASCRGCHCGAGTSRHGAGRRSCRHRIRCHRHHRAAQRAGAHCRDRPRDRDRARWLVPLRRRSGGRLHARNQLCRGGNGQARDYRPGHRHGARRDRDDRLWRRRDPGRRPGREPFERPVAQEGSRWRVRRADARRDRPVSRSERR